MVADLAVPEDRARIVDETLAAWGGVDILVNNAARGFYGPTMEMSRKRLLLSFEINLYAPIDLMQRVVPSMRNRGGGWILNVSSATTRMPGPAPWGRDERYERFHREKGPTIYASTKAALERMSAGAAAELSADCIAVNTLAPVEAVASEGAVDMGAIDATGRCSRVMGARCAGWTASRWPRWRAEIFARSGESLIQIVVFQPELIYK